MVAQEKYQVPGIVATVTGRQRGYRGGLVSRMNELAKGRTVHEGSCPLGGYNDHIPGSPRAWGPDKGRNTAKVSGCGMMRTGTCYMKEGADGHPKVADYRQCQLYQKAPQLLGINNILEV